MVPIHTLMRISIRPVIHTFYQDITNHVNSELARKKSMVMQLLSEWRVVEAEKGVGLQSHSNETTEIYK